LLSSSLKQILEKNKLTLIVSLPENRWDLARAAIQSGVDAIKLHVNVEHRASGNHFGPVQVYEEVFRSIREEFSGPLGIVPGGSYENIKRSEMDQIIDLGFNFYSIYAYHMPSWMVQLDPIEKTFAISNEYPFSQLGSVKHLGVSAIEASIVPGEEYGSPLTFKDILAYHALVQNVDVPVLVPSQRKIETFDVPLLYRTGIKAIMLGAIVVGHTEESVKESILSFREAIDSL